MLTVRAAKAPRCILEGQRCHGARIPDSVQPGVRSGQRSGLCSPGSCVVPRVLLTTSCTHALELAALLLDVKPGDEVIVPSFTFSSTANAFVLRGARIVFADIRPDTLNID